VAFSARRNKENLYERLTGPDGSVVIELDGLKNAGPKLQALATLAAHRISHFLAT